MSKPTDYIGAVEAIKQAILQSQYQAAKGANAVQLGLCYAVGEYVSANSRNGRWGQGALKEISTQLQKELPGLRGFSECNLKYMRTFFEEWSPFFIGGNSAVATAELREDVRRRFLLHRFHAPLSDSCLNQRR